MNTKWTQKSFSDLLTGMFHGGNWVGIHRGLLKQVGLEGSAMLSYLINYHARVKRSPGYRWKDGWFYLTVAKMQEELDVKTDAQSRILNVLSSAGLIEVGRKGVPCRRHIRIDCEAVAKIISDWESMAKKEEVGDQRDLLDDEILEAPGTQSGEIPATQSGEIPATQSGEIPATQSGEIPATLSNKRQVKRKKEAGLTARPPRGSPLSGKVQPAEWDRKAAGRVREMLVANDSDLTAPKGKQRAVGIDKLAEQVAKLQADRGVDRSEIKAVILWYAEHYADDYVPKLRKAADLFDCWGKIRDAKARWGTDRRRADNNGNGKVNGKKSRSRLVPEDADTCSDDDLAWMRKVAAVMVECMKQMQERGRDPWSWGGIGDDDVARALEKKKLPAGFCTADDCRRIGNCAPSRS